jgi:hypothetical protein
VAVSLTRVAFGMTSLAALIEAVARRGENGTMYMTTRYRPKRADEMVGGSLYWIIKHQLVARAKLIGFEEAEGGRTNIVVEARVIPVMPTPRRAHQGWRYLPPEDAPADLADGDAGVELLPSSLITALAEAGLV